MTSVSPTLSTTTRGVAVSFRNIIKNYGAVRALDELSLEIEPGEFVALLGPSGCGKTTALRSLAGLEDIGSGQLLIDGEDITAVPVNRRDLGMVFQSYSLFPNLDVRRNVEFGLQTRGVSAAERTRRALDMLALVGLAGFENRYADELSGGQQQRVALARALVTNPRVLLLDEPLSALDAKVRQQLREEIRRIQLTLGITTVFVTHDQEEALAMADRIAVMNAGVIEQIGTPEELYQRPATPFVAAFVGQSNVLTGEVSEGRIGLLGTRLELLNPELPAGTHEALIRPEDLTLHSEDDLAGVAGEVTATSFLGSWRRTTVRLTGGTDVRIQHPVTRRYAVGEPVRVSVAAVAVTARPVS
ncbi:ABC transporter ATP-binding protein [Mycetocola spongiae]|uniref:ABC transporter ATP-binding protein n=1 Tax=Mycetocola spongiae TaxID=2859226 RepID=UPI001CF305D4|nr:ABC transporter ATP-binding protein [Mycetocola spongiae]UCR87913.1 ABC transporter ATP-binding protein [Mycetocola spongiae]